MRVVVEAGSTDRALNTPVEKVSHALLAQKWVRCLRYRIDKLSLLKLCNPFGSKERTTGR
jgi:hypothetical protein